MAWVSTQLSDLPCAAMREGRSPPEQIHAQQGFPLANGLLGPHGLIANTDAMLIGAHLGPPEPRRAAQDHSVSL